MLTMTNIPIKNIYYIALYAWNKVKGKERVEHLDLEAIETVNDVIIDLFLRETSHLIKRGLYGDYIADNHETEFVKGKINIKESLYITGPALSCHYDEFSQNNLLNQLLKSTLKNIFFLRHIKASQQKKVRNLLLSFHNVDDVMLYESAFKEIQYNRLNQDYEFAIDLAYLIYKHSIPTKEKQVNKFISVEQNEEKMSEIFEEFLRNFYRMHTSYPVHARRYNWDLEAIDGSNIRLIPRMETDIEIEKPEEKIIMDAKYYQQAFTYHFDSQSFISANLYQITAYLRKSLEKDERALRGILIYPTNGHEFHEKYTAKEGYTIEFKSINLNQAWWKIEKELLMLI